MENSLKVGSYSRASLEVRNTSPFPDVIVNSGNMNQNIGILHSSTKTQEYYDEYQGIKQDFPTELTVYNVEDHSLVSNSADLNNKGNGRKFPRRGSLVLGNSLSKLTKRESTMDLGNGGLLISKPATTKLSPTQNAPILESKMDLGYKTLPMPAVDNVITASTSTVAEIVLQPIEITVNLNVLMVPGVDVPPNVTIHRTDDQPQLTPVQTRGETALKTPRGETETMLLPTPRSLVLSNSQTKLDERESPTLLEQSKDFQGYRKHITNRLSVNNRELEHGIHLNAKSTSNVQELEKKETLKRKQLLDNTKATTNIRDVPLKLNQSLNFEVSGSKQFVNSKTPRVINNLETKLNLKKGAVKDVNTLNSINANPNVNQIPSVTSTPRLVPRQGSPVRHIQTTKTVLLKTRGINVYVTETPKETLARPFQRQSPFVRPVRPVRKSARGCVGSTEARSNPLLVQGVVSNTVLEDEEPRKSEISSYAIRQQYGQHLEKNWFKSLIREMSLKNKEKESASQQEYPFTPEMFYSPEPSTDEDENIDNDTNAIDGGNCNLTGALINDTHGSPDYITQTNKPGTPDYISQANKRGTPDYITQTNKRGTPDYITPRNRHRTPDYFTQTHGIVDTALSDISSGSILSELTRYDNSLADQMREDNSSDSDKDMIKKRQYTRFASMEVLYSGAESQDGSDIEFVLKNGELLQKRVKNKMYKKHARKLVRFNQIQSTTEDASQPEEQIDLTHVSDKELRAMRLKLKKPKLIIKLRGIARFRQFVKSLCAVLYVGKRLKEIRRARRIRRRQKRHMSLGGSLNDNEDNENFMRQVRYKNLKERFMAETGQKLMDQVNSLAVKYGFGGGGYEVMPSMPTEEDDVPGERKSRYMALLEELSQKGRSGQKEGITLRTGKQPNRSTSCPELIKPRQFRVLFTPESRSSTISPNKSKSKCGKRNKKTYGLDAYDDEMDDESCGVGFSYSRRRKSSFSANDAKHGNSVNLRDLLRDVNIPAKEIKIQIAERRLRKNKPKKARTNRAKYDAKKAVEANRFKLPEFDMDFLNHLTTPSPEQNGAAVSTTPGSSSPSSVTDPSPNPKLITPPLTSFSIRYGPVVKTGTPWQKKEPEKKDTWTTAELDAEIANAGPLFLDMVNCRYIRWDRLRQAMVNRMMEMN